MHTGTHLHSHLGTTATTGVITQTSMPKTTETIITEERRTTGVPTSQVFATAVPSTTGYTEEYDTVETGKRSFGSKIKGAFKKLVGSHPNDEVDYTETGIDPVTGQRVVHRH